LIQSRDVSVLQSSRRAIMCARSAIQPERSCDGAAPAALCECHEASSHQGNAGPLERFGARAPNGKQALNERPRSFVSSALLRALPSSRAW
jgi:hypothetical protein